MKRQSPYYVQHIKLNELEAVPKHITDDNGIYSIFWWKDIALGHLFTEPNQSFTSEEHFIKIKETVISCINFYLKKHDQWNEDILLNNRIDQSFSDWKAILENHFEKIIAKFIPSSVSVSVIVCTRNRPAFLKKCLLQLQNLECRPAEIIVVDNASDDDSSAQITKEFKDIKYVWESRPGLDIARNAGIKNATHPLIAYVDDDVVVHPKWLYAVWETFEDASIDAMTGLVIALKLETKAQQIFEKYWSFNRGYIDKMYDTTYFKQTLQKGPPVWEIGAGANMAFRKSVFDEVGYFDEMLDVGAAGCNGDSEMWFRILANNHTILYNPRAVVHHEHRSDMKGLKKQIYYYMRGFTVAALAQQKQVRNARYSHHLLKSLPIRFAKKIRRGFPKYTFQYTTLWDEIKGVLSGVAFYTRNRKKFYKSCIK